MRLVIADGMSQKVLRHLAGLSPTSGTINAMYHLGAMYTTGGLSLAGSAAGFAAKGLEEAITKGKAKKALKIVQAGGKRSDAFAPDNAGQRLAKSVRQPLGRTLGIGGVMGIGSL
jgi:hypothetical protein